MPSYQNKNMSWNLVSSEQAYYTEGFSKTAGKAVFRLVKTFCNSCQCAWFPYFFLLRCSPDLTKLLSFTVRDVQSGMQASCFSKMEQGSRSDSTLLFESNKKNLSITNKPTCTTKRNVIYMKLCKQFKKSFIHQSLTFFFLYTVPTLSIM